MLVATLTNYLLKALARGSVTLQLLPKIDDGAVSGDFFEEINLFIPFYILFKSLWLFWK